MKYFITKEKVWMGDMIFEDPDTKELRLCDPEKDSMVRIYEWPGAIPDKIIFIGVAQNDAEIGEEVRVIECDDTFVIEARPFDVKHNINDTSVSTESGLRIKEISNDST